MKTPVSLDRFGHLSLPIPEKKTPTVFACGRYTATAVEGFGTIIHGGGVTVLSPDSSPESALRDHSPEENDDIEIRQLTGEEATHTYKLLRILVRAFAERM